MSSELKESADRFVANSRYQWAELVRVAMRTHPKALEMTARSLAEASGVGKSNLLRKLEAIQALVAQDYGEAQLITLGQANTMSRFVKGKKNEREEDLVYLRFAISPGLKEALLQNLWRISKVLHLRTQEHTLEFINSLLTDLDDVTIKHYAGEGK